MEISSALEPSYVIYGSDLASVSGALKINLHSLVESEPSDDLVIYDWGAGDGRLLNDAVSDSSKRIRACGCTLEYHPGLPPGVVVGDILGQTETVPRGISLFVSHFGILHLFLQLLAHEQTSPSPLAAHPSSLFAEHLGFMLSRLDSAGVAVFNMFNPESLNGLYNQGRISFNENHYGDLITDLIIRPVCDQKGSALALMLREKPNRDWPTFVVAADTDRMRGHAAATADIFEVVKRGEWQKEEFARFINAARASVSIRLEDEEFNIWRFLREAIRIDPNDYY